MHYANGKPAKNGDKIVLFPWSGNPLVGILYDAVEGNDYCNGKIAPINVNDTNVNLKECLLLEDVKALIPKQLSEVGQIVDSDPQLT